MSVLRRPPASAVARSRHALLHASMRVVTGTSCHERAVFLPEPLVVALVDLQTALVREATCGAFFRTLPALLHARLCDVADDGGMPRPDVDDALVADALPGIADGRFPGVLDAWHARWVPDDLLHDPRFFRRAFDMTGDVWREVVDGRAAALTAALRARGYVVVDDDARITAATSAP
jgi:hypothetical protein